MTRKILIHGFVLGALAIALSGCVYGPVPAYYGGYGGYDAYYGYPAGGYYASPSISFRFFHGGGWYGQRWYGGRWHGRR